MKKILILIFLISFCSLGLSWYNDLGNDSCLTIYSDKSSYPVPSFNRQIEAVLMFENDCGSPLNDIDLGLFLPENSLNQISFNKIFLYKENDLEEINKSYVCEHDFNYSLNPNYAFCFLTDINGENKILWEGEFDSGDLPSKTINWSYQVPIESYWKDVTQTVVSSIDAKNIPLGLQGFDLKFGWKEISIPEGKNKFKIIFKIGEDYSEKKEFVVAARSKNNQTYVSVLDPNWYDENYLYRKAVTLKTSSISLGGDLTTDHVILVDFNSAQTDFWDHVDSSGKDIRAVNADNNVLLDFYVQKFDYAGEKMLSWVKVEDPFDASSDISFYIYYGNASASDVNDASATLTNYSEVWHLDETAGTTAIGEKYDFNLTATNAAIWDDTNAFRGDSSADCASLYGLTHPTLWDTPGSAIGLSFWVRLNVPNAANPFLFIKENSDDVDDLYFYLRDDAGGDFIRHYVRTGGGGGTYDGDPVGWNVGEWNQWVFNWDGTNGFKSYNNGVLSEDQAALTSVMGNGTSIDFTFCSVADYWTGGIDEIKVSKMVMGADDIKLLYASESGSLQEYSSEQGYNNNPDVNAYRFNTANDSTYYNFNQALPSVSYSVDGDLSIDFNVYDPDNDRLTIDFNYSTSNTQGGTVILNDVNLTSSYCSNIDWDTSPKTCSYTWNYSAIPDNNYYFLFEVSDGSATDFNASANSLKILISPQTQNATERYFSEDDIRILDTNQFISPTSKKARQLIVENYRFSLAQDYQFLFNDEQPLALYSTIAIILLLSVVFIFYFLRRRK